ncbi:conserved hypothetical protein [Echinococcus multilocularis]|uniref:DRBM domain-containing protein n=1 Tax=Echinococcus multilocularis TaxID=6211 RepID=A0A068YFS8_ECHMU|nr:conserved hypothetical protein [Echinococcus multilocularis]
MDPSICTKRRKTEGVKPPPRQVDAHIRAFINAVITSAQKSTDSSTSTKSKLASVVGKSFVKRKRNVPRCDASTQTEEEDFIEPPTPVPQPPPSPTALLSENAAAYYASTATSEGPFSLNAGPSNTDLQYFASNSVSKISSSEVRQLLTNWMRQYEQWFYQNFGVDVNSVPTEIHTAHTPAPPPPPPPPPPPRQQDSDSDRAVACQTPFRISSGPVMYPQPLIYAPASMNPLASILSAQVAAQNFLPRYIITQQTQQQEQIMAVAAAAASMAALPTPLVCLPPAKPRPTVAPVPVAEADTAAGIDLKVAESLELCGPVTQYGAYGILRPCPLDVMDTQNGNGHRGGTREGGEELPIYITPEDYRNRPHSWMPPPPPTVLLIRKQTLVCVMQLQIRKKAHEIDMRKASATKAPVNIDYVAALESTVEKYVKVKVTYVFNRINRLPTKAQTPFIYGLKHVVLESPSIEKESVLPLPPTQSPVTTENTNCEPEENIVGVTNKPPSSNSLDIDEEDAIADSGGEEGEEDVEIDATREEHSKAMYICDLLIGDIFICQALADCKLQAKACAAREALVLLSRPNFLVGGVRTWYGKEAGYSGVDYLTLCLSPKADQVPQLTPFLADPLVPIPSDQPVNPGDPAESYRVCNPKPFHDLWLYTALPIAVNVDNALVPEQFLAQSAEFSQMTVNFEVEFDSAKGVFTAFGLVDAQRCVKATAINVAIARANAASRLLRRLKTSQPVVGLLLPPPDPGDEELVGPRIQDDEDSMHPLWGLTEASIVDSLMWGKHEKQFALPIEHLEAHCEIFGSSSANRNTDPEFAAAGSGFFTSHEHLERYLEAYAASALVTPLRISLRALPHALWHFARTAAHSWGLLTRIEFEVPEHLNTAFLLVCKRAPLPRLKRTLFERTEVGVFYLLSCGDLPPPALRSLSEADLLDAEPASAPTPPSAVYPPTPLSDPFNQEDDEMGMNDSLTRMARTFHATAIKREASDTVAAGVEVPEEADLMLVSAELNQPSNAVEILDDLPRQLIPGIDF